MKHLSILRHAKAERPEQYDADLARPLTKRGRKDAAHMGEILAKSEPAIDWVVSSPAQRTRDTTEALYSHLPGQPKIVWQETIYEATLITLLDVLHNVPSTAEHVLLIGHNPGMEELASALCTGAPDRLHIHMTTAALVSVRLEVHSWNQTRPGCGILLFFLRPNLIR